MQGHNLFAYSFNDPINLMDDNGHWPREITANVYKGVKVAGDMFRYTGNGGTAALCDMIAFDVAAIYMRQCTHYDLRKAMNVDLPANPDEAKAAGWKGPGSIKGPSAACHQYTAISKDKPNIKYVSPDGYREVIFNANGQLVTDSRDIGTYNISPSGINPIGHLVYDIIPWIAFGNDDDDPGPIINNFLK